MSRRTKKIVTVVAIAVVLSWSAMVGIIYKVTRSAFPRADSGKPYKFAAHRGPSRSRQATATAPDETGLADFTSNIPVIVLRSDGPISPSKTYSDATLEVYEPTDKAAARFGPGPTLTVSVGLRIHGMLSRSFPKQSYRIKIQNGSGGNGTKALLGMPADTDWILQGPWLDKSLIRNAFSYDLARAMGCGGMRTRPCEVFVSASGQRLTEANYMGVYYLTEHIDRGKERVNVTKLAPDETSEPAITGGYILAWDAGEGNYLPSWQPVNGRASLQLHYPKHASNEQVQWIDRAFREFDAAVRGPNFRDPAKGYAAHIDTDAWVNYILCQELIFNLDAYDRSFYLQKDRGGKIRPGPVWDHDLALGHQLQRGTRFNTWWYSKRPRPNAWITQLVRDPEFSGRMAQRWSELRKGVLSDAQMAARLDAYAEPLLSGAADRNFDRWTILNVKYPPNRLRNITIATPTYAGQITAIKDFLRQRAAWMDEHLQR